MPMKLIQKIKEALAQPLPGRNVQLKMAHANRHIAQATPEDARVACVLALLYPKDKEWHTVLILRRSNNENDRHKGQVSFPGGQLEDSDPSLEAGALREAEEEVGVLADQVEILGRLTELYIPVSNFLVHPFVGYTTSLPDFKPQLSEVKEILEIPLAKLTDPNTVSQTDIKIGKNITLKRVPFFNLNNKVVWGATAMMLNEFLEVVRTAQKELVLCQD